MTTEDKIRGYATWTVAGEERRKALHVGRYLIGDSPFATIKIGDAGQSLAGLLQVGQKGMTLKCTASQPTIFVDGRRLVPGESVVIADVMEALIGSTPLLIAGAHVSKKNENIGDDLRRDRRKRSREMSAKDLLQEAADKSLASPDRLRFLLSRRLLEELNVADVDLAQIDSPEVRETARLKLRKILADLRLPDDFVFSKDELERQVYDEVLGLGPLEPMLEDERVTEIMVNRRDQIFVERDGKISESAVTFSSDQSLLNVIERIVSTVGRRIDVSSPIVDARLLDGSRVNAVIPPLAIKGPCLTIRRFSKTPISPEQLVEWGSLTETMCRFLRASVEEHKNIIISGGTGSGKTTLLNALSSFIPNEERIVTVEDAAELQLQQEHIVSLETRPPNLEGKGAVSIRDLVKNTLRMRPDRIIVGECRSGEALDMLQAMNTGHDGSMTTAHANTPEDMLRRLETMVLMAGMDLPLRAIREQIVSAITIVVQQSRRKTGRRLVTDIAWIRGLGDKGEYDLVPLFTRDAKDKETVHRQALGDFLQVEEYGATLTAITRG